MSATVHVEQIRGHVDFAVLTIREDEFLAVLDRLAPSRPVLGGKQFYESCMLRTNDGTDMNIAVARALDQGHGVAQAAAHLVIDDLSPAWLILAGIAGGVPDNEFTLGDVLLASSLIDLSVTAAMQDGGFTYRTSGGHMHRDVERLLAVLPAWKTRLGNWNQESELNVAKPDILVPDDCANDAFYGPPEFREKVQSTLLRHFPKGDKPRAPIYRGDVLATSNVLVKQYELLADWQRVARHLSHIEMEAGGVYHAARHGGDQEIPLLCVRGLSDIVGFNRSPEWTNFACQTAASFVKALITILPAEMWGTSLPPRPTPPDPGDTYVQKTPSTEDVAGAFARTSEALLRLAVDAEKRIERQEEFALQELLKDEDTRVALLLGPPGSGKTCLLAKVAQEALDRNIATLAIKADMFPHDDSFDTWGQRILDLDVSIFDAVKAVSARTALVVIVDQLDALASTVDLTSSRLNEILDFVIRCSELPNVSVLCSCRDFEFQYDTRLRGLNATTVNLSLPTWELVAQQLSKRGISESDKWPDAFKELLRTPQHLGIFLRHVDETGKASPFDSYQAMLSGFWSRAVTSADESRLLKDLTSLLIKTESLWVPHVKFENDTSTIESLQAKGMLAKKDERIGFAHQTLLEYAKARYFTETETSLASFVLEQGRQDSILIRPTAWSVLTYLRNADPDKYRVEIELLFANQLRLHLRFLLIEFICRQSDPREFEVSLIGERLGIADERIRILIAIRGSKSWFRSFHLTHFPTIMRLENHDQWPMISLLTDAWDFAFDDCLRLLKQHWFPNKERDPLTHRAIRECGNWNDQTVEIARTVIRRNDAVGDRAYWMEDLVSVVSAARPKLAPQLFVEAVTRDSLQSTDAKSQGRRDSLLESSQGWYNLPEVAAAAPFEFLSATWLWVVQAAETHHSGHSGSVLYAYAGYCIAMEDEEWSRHSSVLSAVFRAIDDVSEQNPEGFIEITKPTWDSENLVVHRLLLRGLIRCVETAPSICLEYLLGDRRRMCVGRYGDTRDSESVALVRAVYPHLSGQQRTRLVNSIQNWSPYRDDVEPCDRQQEWSREARLHLLKAIPQNLVPADVAEFIEREMTELPGWDRELMRSRSGSIRQIPPMTKDEMEAATDKSVVDAFSKPEPNSGARDWQEVDGGWSEEGGASSAGRELEQLTKDNPQRGIQLMRVLAKASKIDHLGGALRAVGESDASDEEVFQLILELNPWANESAEFRSEASYVLYKRSRHKVGLPDNVCEVLENWLQMPWGDSDVDSDNSSEDEWKGESSVLWERSGSRLLHVDESFFTLSALTLGRLQRDPPDGDNWMRVLDEQLDRKISFRTWKTFSQKLRWLRLEACDREKAAAIAAKSFAKFPNLRLSREGICLLAYVSDLFTDDEMKALMQSIRRSSDPSARQGYGELLTLLAMRKGEHDWANEWLDAELAQLANQFDPELQPIGVGIGFAAAELWSDLDMPKEAAGILSRLHAVSDEKVGRAANTVFWATESFAADEHTELLLDSLATNVSTLDGNAASSLLEHLCELLPHLRIAILRLCRALVDTRFEELKQMGFGAYSVGPSLVEISMTLQRFGDTRSDGLTLLEDLLRAGLDDADAILNEVDLRPASSVRRERRRRRRRKSS